MNKKVYDIQFRVECSSICTSMLILAEIVILFLTEIFSYTVIVQLVIILQSQELTVEGFTLTFCEVRKLWAWFQIILLFRCLVFFP